MAEIASALRDSDHIVGILDVISDELLAQPTEPLLMYLVDTAPASALYFLASQFGVLGANGWRFASNETQQRNLIKSAIRLQRTKGTPGAIINAVKTLGYGTVEITTALGIYYDGTYVADGTITAGQGGDGHWANFRVRIDLDPGVPINPETTEAVTALVNAYKNARSVLVDITWRIGFDDVLEGSDVLDTGDSLFVDSLTGELTYDGTARADGSTQAGSSNDELNIRILPA